MSGRGALSALVHSGASFCFAHNSTAYLAAAALAAALRSFSTSAAVSFGGSTEIVSLSILPLNLNGHSITSSARVQRSLEGWRGRAPVLPLTAVKGASVILVLSQYICIGCSPGKHPDTRTMATGSDDDSRDSVHDRYLCIAV